MAEKTALEEEAEAFLHQLAQRRPSRPAAFDLLGPVRAGVPSAMENHRFMRGLSQRILHEAGRAGEFSRLFSASGEGAVSLLPQPAESWESCRSVLTPQTPSPLPRAASPSPFLPRAASPPPSRSPVLEHARKVKAGLRLLHSSAESPPSQLERLKRIQVDVEGLSAASAARLPGFCGHGALRV